MAIVLPLSTAIMVNDLVIKRKECPIRASLLRICGKNQDFFSLERLTAERIPTARQIKPIRA